MSIYIKQTKLVHVLNKVNILYKQLLIFYADLGYFYGLESFLELSLYG